MDSTDAQWIEVESYVKKLGKNRTIRLALRKAAENQWIRVCREKPENP